MKVRPSGKTSKKWLSSFRNQLPPKRTVREVTPNEGSRVTAAATISPRAFQKKSS